MGRSVGLEIHTRGVRAVELVGSGKKVRVQRYIERPVTPRGGACATMEALTTRLPAKPPY